MGGVLALLLTLVLITLLLLREMISGIDGERVKQLRQGLNLVVGPLALVFFIVVVSRLSAGEIGRVSAISERPTPTAVAPSPAAQPTALADAAPSPIAASGATSAVPTAAVLTPASTAQPVVFVEDTFNAPSNGWPARDNGTWSAAYVDGRYQLALKGQSDIGVSTELPLVAYRFSLDVSVQKGGAGVVFLAAEPATFYRLLLSNDGAYTIQRVDQTSDVVTSIVDWTASAALRRDANAVNRLRFERQGDTVRFYANDQDLATFTIPSGRFLNRYGFALTSRKRDGLASFDNLIGELWQ